MIFNFAAIFFLSFTATFKGLTSDTITDFWYDLPAIDIQDDTDDYCEFRVFNIDLNGYLKRDFNSLVKSGMIMNQQNYLAISKLAKDKLILFVLEPDE